MCKKFDQFMVGSVGLNSLLKVFYILTEGTDSGSGQISRAMLMALGAGSCLVKTRSCLGGAASLVILRFPGVVGDFH